MTGEYVSPDDFLPTATAVSGVEYYQPYCLEIPPDDEWLVKYNGWWGCQWVLVRHDSPPDRAEDFDLSDVFESVDKALGREAIPADLSPARLTGRLADGKHPVAFQIGAAEGLAADPRFLLYAEAVAEVEEWFYLCDPDRDENAHWLEGRRGGERVALVAPFRIAGGSLIPPVPAEPKQVSGRGA